MVRISHCDNAFSRILELKGTQYKSNNCSKKTRKGENGKAQKITTSKIWFVHMSKRKCNET